jgi:hypothetical protein
MLDLLSIILDAGLDFYGAFADFKNNARTVIL